MGLLALIHERVLERIGALVRDVLFARLSTMLFMHAVNSEQYGLEAVFSFVLALLQTMNPPPFQDTIDCFVSTCVALQLRTDRRPSEALQ